MEHIYWHTFSLDKTSEALFGHEQLLRANESKKNSDNLDTNAGITIGFTRGNVSYNPPSIILIEDRNVADIFSWLKVYAPETSPMSQFARVLSKADWQKFFHNSEHHNSTSLREDRWASVVLGELLAQGDADIELSTVPLSRATACFSTAMARSSIIHGHGSAVKECIIRLKLLEEDQRFVQRLISVNDMLPIWTILTSQIEEPLDPKDVAKIVVLMAQKYGRESLKIDSRLSILGLEQYPELLSDSIEERIVAFQRLASEVATSFSEFPLSSYPNALLAAGAFLAGRGTTHAFLLRRWTRKMPAVFAWFGLMVALTSPDAWDPTWSRAVKGIERQLRVKFDWTDIPAADLCWTEYSWMAKIFDGFEVFNELPKLFPKVLSIEVIPGATCQLRLSSTLGDNDYESEQRHRSETEQRDIELRMILAQMVDLGLKARQLLGNHGSQPLPTQRSLRLEDVEGYTKNSQVKRAKRHPKY